ncbi:hypothetical protein [Pseudomonas glycinae]|nr:hypothetical protein [Pseudomonas glycinae]
MSIRPKAAHIESDQNTFLGLTQTTCRIGLTNDDRHIKDYAMNTAS